MSSPTPKQSASWTAIGCAGALAVSACALVPLVLMGLRVEQRQTLVGASAAQLLPRDASPWRAVDVRAAEYAAIEGARGTGEARPPADDGDRVGAVVPAQVWIEQGPALVLVFRRPELVALRSPGDSRPLWISLDVESGLTELPLDVTSQSGAGETSVRVLCRDLRAARSLLRELVESP